MRTRAQRESQHAASVRVLLAFVTTAAAWLVALTHLTAALHFALISHEICADHGELVHGSSSAHAAPPLAHGVVALPAGEHAGHEHCPLFSRRLEHTAVLSAPVALLAPPPATLMGVCGERPGVAPSRAALLLAAPKQSPPVAG